jgi:hypothetical protein
MDFYVPFYFYYLVICSNAESLFTVTKVHTGGAEPLPYQYMKKADFFEEHRPLFIRLPLLLAVS